MAIVDTTNRDDVTRYEKFVSESPYGNFMQSMNWARVKNNWESDYVYLEDDRGQIRAAMSLLSVKNDGAHSFVYCPRGPVCDFADIDTVKELLAEAQKIVKERNGFLLRMDPEIGYSEDLIERYKNSGIENMRIMTGDFDLHAFSNPRIHMIADLSRGTYEDYWETLKSKSKNKIRRSYKFDLTTVRFRKNEEGFTQALDTFYELTEIMAARQGISYRPKAYFLRLFESFEDVFLYQTQDEEEVLASSILLRYNKKAFYAYAASSNNKREKYPSYHMNNEMIKDAVDMGAKEYDMGGVFLADDKDGLYLFKKVFCNEEGVFSLLGQFDIVFDEALYADFVK
ncbi:MAG: peptidoglycan bridge formation glycyltransferase FemA/FemB family protein [Ndongobacter sp.]|nr:peptidoglycan bridge formation glycyltransferase FemA/FemB family protein [Ndongobacter sp.]